MDKLKKEYLTTLQLAGDEDLLMRDANPYD